MKVKRNKYGAPVGIILTPTDALKLRRLREKDANKRLPEKELEEAIEHFKQTYPDKVVAGQLRDMSKGASEEDAAELLGNIEDAGGDDDEEEEEDEELPSIKEMRDILKDNGIACSPNAKDETVQKKYEEFLDSQEDGNKE